MYTEKYTAIIVNGQERFFRTNPKEATRTVNRLRAQHGPYNVWTREHFRLLSSDGSIVNV